MSLRRIAYMVGAVVMAIGVLMLVPAGVALIYQEWSDAVSILMAAALTAGIGALAWRSLDRPGELTTREGFAAVGLAWIAMAFAGTLPYLLTGSITSFTDAIFETAAGFTTTGSSILADPAVLSHGILFWRSMTQWLGGMGVIVLSIAILPLLGVGGVQLARAESPGVTPDRLTPRFQETAKRLWLLYMLITIVEVGFLWAGDMSLFEAINHSFTTMSTGGFSTHAGSLGAFSAYSQWVVIFFMTLAGISFALHYRGLARPLEYARSAELRLYLGVIFAAGTIAIVGTWGGGVGETIRGAVFTVVSIVTTTGFGTADFATWAIALQIMLVGIMFVGGMAGSTAGGIKTVRLGVLYRASRNDIRRLIHPRGIFVTRFGKNPISDSVVESVQSFFLLYMFIFMTGTLLFGIAVSAAGSSLDIPSSASAVASALNNIGPGLGEVGPTANYAAVPAAGKWLLSGLMIVGRIEVFPILLLFTRELWRR